MTILVTGATGRQGGAVARRLLASGRPVRALTRRPHAPAAQSLAALGAEIVEGDFDDAEALRHALHDVARVFSTQTPYEAGVAAEERQGIAFAEAARRAGVEQFVFSSVAGAELPTGVPHFESKGRIERQIEGLGFRHWSFLRPTFFMEMLASAGNRRALARGRVELALDPGTRVAMIAIDDIARMAEAAFAEPERWHGQAIVLAGDEPDMRDVATALGRALARPVAYQRVPADALDPETRPKRGTQEWLERVGWAVDVATLRKSYPFEALRLCDWAMENAAVLASTPPP